VEVAGQAQVQETAITLVRDPGDAVADRPAVGRAIERLRGALEREGLRVRLASQEPPEGEGGAVVVVAGASSSPAERIQTDAEVFVPRVPEALGLVPGRPGERSRILATGADARGLAYAVLELADRVELGRDPHEALRLRSPIVERPANEVRSLARLFASEPDDKPWLHDEDFWRRYLSMVVAQRFNRLNLMVGLGYNFPWHVTDGYLYFAYPFLVDVAGVRVRELPDEERDRNLQMLRFASEEAAAVGLDFQIGLWTHAYELIDSPDARHTIEGLTPETHAAYCGEALRTVLEACPAIGGVTIRTHGESGVPERSWEFWKAVFDGVSRTGRRVELDLHAKGLDRATLDLALETGLPVTISPKFSAEHMGLPYHQAAMRDLDRPPSEEGERGRGTKSRFMTVSEGSRPFTRYSYGDFLREDREYRVVFRIWPGTQRVLLWGDPAMASGLGRNAGLAGSEGLEVCDPHSLKGREGSAVPGSRDGYADPSLSTGDDWAKHDYTYRLFGRLLYNPDAEPSTWRRHLRATLGLAAMPAEAALASASRILPLVTSAHHPSASNNYYWPEVYTDIGIVGIDGAVETHYYDTPEPKRFGTVGPLDPELFSTVVETVGELLGEPPSGRCSSIDVSAWLERLSDDAEDHLARVDKELGGPARAPLRRLIVDVGIQAAIGRFFAWKLRSATLYETFVRTGGTSLLRDALEALRAARDALADAAERARGVYVDDLTYGPQAWLRGTWADRLPAVDRDLEAMEALEAAPFRSLDRDEDELRRAITSPALSALVPAVVHDPPIEFDRGEPLTLSIDVDARATSVEGVGLRYRHVDQSTTYDELEMIPQGEGFTATIPAAFADSPYAIQYFFVVRDVGGGARLHPGLGPRLSDRPYYVIRARR
jgi:hypothetical protein